MSRKSLIVLTAVALIIQGGISYNLAQENIDKELELLKKQKEYAETRKAIAEAELAELKARFPEPKTAPLAGTTTINDGAVIESQMVSYALMARAANQMAKTIKVKEQPNPQNLIHRNVFVIYDKGEVNNILGYRSAMSQLQLLQDNYCEVIDPAIAGPPCPAPGVAAMVAPLVGLKIAQSFLGGFVDTLALLRTNVDIKGTTFAIEDDALVSETFRGLREQYAGYDLALYYPAVFPPDLDLGADYVLLQQLELVRNLKIKATVIAQELNDKIQELKKVNAAIAETGALISPLETEEAQLLLNLQGLPAGPSVERARLDARLGTVRAELQKLRPKRLEQQAKKAQVDAELATILTRLNGIYKLPANASDALAKLAAFNLQFDQLLTALLSVNQTTGANLLTGYIKAENLNKILSCEGYPSAAGGTCRAYWLQLKVLRAGGNNRIKTNLVTDIFTGGNRLSHSGGSIVQYNLFDRTGQSVLSDTITIYSKYIKSSKVKDLPASLGDVDVQ